MSFVEIFIIFIIVVMIIMYINNYVNTEVEYVKSKVDGRSYLVLSLPDKQNAADYLAEINGDLQALIKHLRAKYPQNENYQRLYKNFDPDGISEGSPDSSYTSFSVNKSQMTICIRQEGSYEFVDKNIILYVVIHELGHMACSQIGHVPVFWAIFKEILTEAVEIGMYKKEDYKSNPAPYCGISISSSII
jgi:hypothetical protein